MVSTRFLILSDTHNFEHDASQSYPLTQKMPQVDVLLHCGDLTQVGGMSAYKKALKMVGTIDAELKLAIAGNHDVSLDGEYWRSHLEEDDEPEEHDEAVEIMTGAFAKAANVTYLTEGLHSFTLKNGTTFKIFVSPYQPACGDWAFGYERNIERWSIPEDADIVMTHGPSLGHLDYGHDQHLGCETLKLPSRSYGAEVHNWDTADQSTEIAKQPVKYSKAGGENATEESAMLSKGTATLFVNAAIMDDHNKPVNAPWLVELPL